MKRTVKQRTLGPGEFAALARQCVDAVLKGEDVFELLTGKGYADPVSEWCDIRRWTKSNAPQLYAQIPMNLRLEIPVHGANPEESQADSREPEEQKTDPDYWPTARNEEPAGERQKRKPGRPPKAKTVETAAQEKKTPQSPPKARPKILISEVQGEKVTYTRRNDKVYLRILGISEELAFTFPELKTLSEELPQVIRALKT